jgi:beta-glucosidase
MRKSYPEFLWGAATSSHQIEGQNDKNDWWEWEAQGHIEGGARSGAATDHWNRFKEDLKLARELGLNSYRFSVEWSRIEPEEGKWNSEALDWYESLIAECEKNQLLPMLTLHHFTSPLWFARKGGFASDQSPQYFSKYVTKVVQKLGPSVPLWCPINEPMVLAVGTYFGKFMPPAEFSPQKTSQACRNLLKSHVLAYDIIHGEIKNRKGPWKDYPVQVGIAHNMLDFMPDRKFHPIDLILVRILRRFYNRAWLDAVTGRKQHFGVLGLIPTPSPVKEAIGRNTADFIGINYYTKAYVQWRPKAPAHERPPELPIGVTFARRKETVSDLDWSIHPAGFYRMIRFVRKYCLPIYITENGIADREDKMRPEFLNAHIEILNRAISEGIDIRGYYHWSLLDNFEWVKGFHPRFGLYRVDYETFARTPTSSAHLYKKIIADSSKSH